MNSTISSGDKPILLKSPDTIRQSGSFKIAEKLKDYMLLVKFNLSFMVVFSAVISYLLAPLVKSFDWISIIRLSVGGMLVTGSANALNQVMEKQTDAMMKRTANRPVASGRMSVSEATSFAIISGLVGAMLLWHFNSLTALLSVFSLFFYAFIYTPLKKVSPICTFVGAFPGAMPGVLGWTAARGQLEWGALVMFAIVFFWQFPHFYSIAWLYRQDYEDGGIRMLPVVEPDGKSTGRQILLYSLALIPISLLPAFLGMSGKLYFAGALVLGIALFYVGGRLASLQLATGNARSKQRARQLLQATVFYLPLLFALMMLNPK